MQYDEIKDFKGLYVQPNSFGLPPGSFEDLHNATLEDKNIISRTRGYYTYFTVTTDEEILGLVHFNETIISVYNTRMAYYTDTGSVPNITGVETPIPEDTPVDITFSTVDRPRFQKSNGNLYMCCDDGVIKLTDFDAKLYQAGSPPALDLFGDYDLGTSATWWDLGTGNSDSKAVGYRVLFGYTDANNNLILGAPSGIFTINNPVVEATISSIAGAGPYTITVTSTSHGLTTGMNMQFMDASGLAVNTNAEGYFTITVTGANTFTYDVPNNPGAITPPATVKYAYAMEVSLNFSVPSQISDDINTGWFFRLYRSDQQLITVGVQSDFKLIDERFLTSQELTDKAVYYNDSKSELFKGELLYTNQNSGEGEVQANYRPPQCKDMALYQGYMFYANCVNRHILEFSVIDPTVLTSTSYLEIKVGSDVRRYFLSTGVGNKEVRAALSNDAGNVLFTYTSHGIPNNGLNTVYVSNADGSLSNGIYYVTYISANTFRISSSLANWQSGTFVAYTTETKADFCCLYQSQADVVGVAWTRSSNVVSITSPAHGLADGMSVYIDNSAAGAPDVVSNIYEIINVPDANTFEVSETAADSAGTLDYRNINYVFYDSSSLSSSAEQIRDTANYLVKAIDRDQDSEVYADYTSTPVDTPGNIRLRAKDFTPEIYLRVTDTATQGAFFPTIPTSYTSPDQVFSATPEQINVLYFSKLQEPEAVPLVNFVGVGSPNNEIVAIHALTNSIIVLKTDGVFRVTGDNPANFVVSLLDATIITAARDSSTVFSNQVALLSNQGVCLVSETSVQIVSRNIENVIQSAIAALPGVVDLDSSGFSYELERSYKLTTVTPEGDYVLYNYNILTDTWSTSDGFFSSAVLGSDVRMYHVDTTKKIIYRERKDNKKTDYTREYHQILVVDASDPNATVVESTSYAPKYGDIIIKDDQLNIIRTSTMVSPSRYSLSMFCLNNLSDGDSPYLYESYEARMKLVPYTGGQVGVMKQFAQMQIHFRDSSCTALDVSFSSDTYDNSKVNQWIAPRCAQGWGQFKWGVLPWSTSDSNDFDYLTTPYPICRMYVSRNAQRSTFFQPIIVNNIGGDRLNIQSIDVAVRKYGERVSR